MSAANQRVAGLLAVSKSVGLFRTAAEAVSELTYPNATESQRELLAAGFMNGAAELLHLLRACANADTQLVHEFYAAVSLELAPHTELLAQARKGHVAARKRKLN